MEWLKARLGLAAPPAPADAPLKVLVAGADGSGKTTLLYAAKRGEIVTTIPTNGFNVETLQPFGLGPPPVVAWDTGGGKKIGPLLYQHYATDCAGLVFVLRPTDPRIWSVLWELYHLVRHLRRDGAASGSQLAVCVVIPIHDCDSSDGTCRVGRDGAESVRWPTLARLAERESLPPGGTERWSTARRWGPSCEPAAAVAGGPEHVDAVWLAAWEADRRDVMHAANEAERWRTRPHGLHVPHEADASPPLARVHSGPWVVLPVDLRAERGVSDALRPFQWVAAHARR